MKQKFCKFHIICAALVIGSIFSIFGCKAIKPVDKPKLLYKGNLYKHFDRGTIMETNFSPDKNKILFIKTHRYEVEKSGLLNYREQYWYKNLITGKKRMLYEIKDYNALSPEDVKLSKSRPDEEAVYAWDPNSEAITMVVYSNDGDETNVKFMNIEVNSGKITTYNKHNLRHFLEEQGMYGLGSIDWSPDGKKIAFGAGVEFSSRVYIYNFKKDKFINRVITEDSVYPGTWSPDSNIIAISYMDVNSPTFKGNVYAQTSLWVKNLKNEKFGEVLKNSLYDSFCYAQNWSKDGKWILFVFIPREYTFRRSINTVDQFFYNFDNKKVYKLKLAKKFKKGKILGWSKDGRDLVVLNKKGLWSMNFKSIQMKEFNLQKQMDKLSSEMFGKRKDRDKGKR